MSSYWLRTWRPRAHEHAFAYAFAYIIKQTPYAFVAKIILCMYLLYAMALAKANSKENSLCFVFVNLRGKFILCYFAYAYVAK